MVFVFKNNFQHSERKNIFLRGQEEMKPSGSADWVMSQLQEQNGLRHTVILKMMLVSFVHRANQ